MANQQYRTQKSLIVIIVALLLIFFTNPNPLFGETDSGESTEMTALLDLSLEELMAIPFVVSASKREESIVQSPSVVRVITKEQIRVQGLKTLAEVISRTTGFYSGSLPSWPTYGSRGIINAPRQYLLLIDGVPQNSIIAFGALHQHTYPLLEKVERVEIISGPGSTLWGSDALMGIVNVVTKDGDVGEKVELTENIWTYDGSVGRAGVNHATSLQYNFGVSEEAKGIVTATFFDGDGFNSMLQTSPGTYQMEAPQLDWDNNGEIYAKATLNNLTIKARYLDGQDNEAASPGDYYNYDLSDPKVRQSTSHVEQAWIEVEHNREFDNGLNLSTKLFAQKLETLRVSRFGPNMNATHSTYREQNKGLETMLSGESDVLFFLPFKNIWKTGFRYTTTKVGPHFVVPTEYVEGGDEGDSMWYISDLSEGDTALNDSMAVDTDNLYGIYAETNVEATEKANVVLGGRIDRNDLREKENIFMPRAALIYEMTDELTFKALYNTGYRRPGVREAGFTKGMPSPASEEVTQYDLQLLYHTPDFQSTLTLYHLDLKNPIVISGGAYQNMGDTRSRGIELEGQFKLTEKSRCYGNTSYSDAISYVPIKNFVHVTNGRYHGIPIFMYNVGVDYKLAEKVMSNVHLTGWGHSYCGFNSPHDRVKGAAEVDLNIVANNLLDSHMEVSLYCTNLFNNNRHYARLRSGTLQAQPRAFGLKAKYRF